jgi:hypothetical protein
MKVALFTPYGFLHRESGLMYLVANYLRASGAEVTQLRCDGAVSVCGRDSRVAGGRSVFSCARCTGEQRRLADWSDIRAYDLSAFVSSEDKVQSAKWMASVQTADLDRAEFRGINLWERCQLDFQRQTGIESIESLSAADEQSLRALYVAFVQGAVASERFVTQWAPALTLVAKSEDSLVHAYHSHIVASGIECSTFAYDEGKEVTVIESVKTGERYSSKLVLDGITSMRRDPRTWAPEVRAVVNEIMAFLGFSADRVV